MEFRWSRKGATFSIVVSGALVLALVVLLRLML